ncbi:Protein of unknown function [Bacillus wiedmannii]|nr:Protein of unknown function [Bacillus wiedmannii]
MIDYYQIFYLLSTYLLHTCSGEFRK